jgi:hypothetical protein
MAKKEAPISQLEHFLPPGTFGAVHAYLQHYHVHLTVARERRSILGDYRHRTKRDNHRISVNGNLNTYAFLITLLHELAHLLAFEQYGNRIASHGKEWKSVFSMLLASFIKEDIFPPDIRSALTQSLGNPAASSCADDVLLRVLKNYDKEKNGLVMVEELPDKTLFRTHDGKIFRKGARLRKRFQCTEVKTGKLYLFSPVYEVEQVEKEKGE